LLNKDSTTTEHLAKLGVSEIEISVILRWIAQDMSGLIRRQLESCTDITREINGSGMYLNFVIKSADVFENDFELNEVYADIEGLDSEVGFLLFVRDGLIKFLEGYTTSGLWPKNITSYRLK
jgi:hypothetical protein